MRCPVLSPVEAPNRPHNRVRGTFAEVDGIMQPAPTPRFADMPGFIRQAPPNPGQLGDEALLEWGYSSGVQSPRRHSLTVSSERDHRRP
jgi:alpha-methylacyl-CoA racemase